MMMLAPVPQSGGLLGRPI